MIRQNTGNTAASIQFNIFSILWAVATLFHMAYQNVFTMKLNYVLLTLAALFVIYKPGSVKGFLIMMVLQLYDIFYLLPNVNNHWLFTAFVNLTILQACIFWVIRNRSFSIDTGRWVKVFAPIVRIELLILYFFAVFHKLNTDFLNPDVSCATDLLKSQNIPLLPLSRTLFIYSGYFTLFIEALIPVLLYFNRTRSLGILLGVGFHSVLAFSSYNGYFDFSSMMLALYFLFIDQQFSAYISYKLNRLKKTLRLGVFSFLKVTAILFAVIIGLLILHVLVNRLHDFQDFNLYVFWLSYNLVVLGMVVAYVFRKTDLNQKSYFSITRWFFWIMPLVAFLNGCSPYLGLKTESSYAMFSNLRTEGGVSNHYLVPASFQMFEFQKKFVKVVSSSDPFLQTVAKEKRLMVLFHFDSYIHSKKPERVEYILDGNAETFLLNGKSSREVKKPFYLFRKVLNFRTFTADAQPCVH